MVTPSLFGVPAGGASTAASPSLGQPSAQQPQPAQTSFLPEKPTVRQLTNFVTQWQNQFEATEDKFRKSEDDITQFLQLHKQLKEMDAAARRDTERLLLRGKEVKALADSTEKESNELLPVCESDTQLCQEINRLYARTCTQSPTATHNQQQLMGSVPFSASVMLIPTPFTTRFLQELLLMIQERFGALQQVQTAVKHLRSEPPEKELELVFSIMEGHYKYVMLCQEKDSSLRNFLYEVRRELEKANIILPGAVLVNSGALLGIQRAQQKLIPSPPLPHALPYMMGALGTSPSTVLNAPTANNTQALATLGQPSGFSFSGNSLFPTRPTSGLMPSTAAFDSTSTTSGGLQFGFPVSNTSLLPTTGLGGGGTLFPGTSTSLGGAGAGGGGLFGTAGIGGSSSLFGGGGGLSGGLGSTGGLLGTSATGTTNIMGGGSMLSTPISSGGLFGGSGGGGGMGLFGGGGVGGFGIK